MKIALLGPVYPLRGGIARHTGRLSQSLAKRGHTVENISFLKQFPRFLFPGVSQLDNSKLAEKIASRRIFIPWNLSSWKHTAAALCQLQPDMAVCVWWTPFTGPGYWYVCRKLQKTGIPLLFLLHNALPHETLPGSRFFSRAAFKQSDGFITQSQKVQDELREIFPAYAGRWNKIIPHPVYDFQEYSFPPQSEARSKLRIDESRVLLFFGLVRKYKGLAVLLQAFPQILTHFRRDVRLLIAGEFYDKQEPYLNLISQLGIHDKVTVENRFIPTEEVGDYFSAADAVVTPYISASQSGIAQTAFGFGKPVLSSNVGGLPEIIQDGFNGMLYPPENPNSLAETVLRFYSLQNQVDWKGNIEKSLSRFSWDNLVNAIEEFYAYSKKEIAER